MFILSFILKVKKKLAAAFSFYIEADASGECGKITVGMYMGTGEFNEIRYDFIWREYSSFSKMN